MTMLYVPAGNFSMGNNEHANEEPIHTVYLDAFWIDRTEVTNSMFANFVADAGYETEVEKGGSSWAYNPSSKQWGDVAGADWQHPYGPSSTLEGLYDHPVVHVSWNDAKAYCIWAGARLPTEAEWEKAARGKDSRVYPWGNTFDSTMLNFCDRNCDLDWRDSDADDRYAQTSASGSYLSGASPYGALDMAGNVLEWVADWYDDDYYANSPERNPLGPDTGSVRAQRGGSWDDDMNSVRATSRGWDGPSNGNDYLGFRCARSDTVEHILKRGETLSEIAELYGVTEQAIIQANKLEDPSHVITGQTLIIPASSQVTSTVTSPPLKVGIVAGHWQNDSGEVCPDGLQEVTINLDVASRLVAILQYEGYDAELLSEFSDRLTGHKADVFVSIHAGPCEASGASGFQVSRKTSSAIPEKEDQLVDCLNWEYAQATLQRD